MTIDLRDFEGDTIEALPDVEHNFASPQSFQSPTTAGDPGKHSSPGGAPNPLPTGKVAGGGDSVKNAHSLKKAPGGTDSVKAAGRDGG